MGATVNRGEIIHARRGVCWRARYARVLVVAHADGESGWLSVYLSCNFLCKTLAGPERFAAHDDGDSPAARQRAVPCRGGLAQHGRRWKNKQRYSNLVSKFIHQTVI